MSFFVSKSLSGKIDESCLLANDNEKESKDNFLLVLENLKCNITEIRFIKNSKKIKLKCTCNIHTVENLLFNKKQGKIIFNKKSIIVDDLKIIKIIKRDKDSYIIDMTLDYEVE